MECFKRFRHIDSHFASKQILKGFERSNHRRVNGVDVNCTKPCSPDEDIPRSGNPWATWTTWTTTSV